MKFEYDIFDVEFDGMPMITNNEDGTYSPTEQCKKIFLDLMNDAAHIDHVFFPPENRFGGVDDIGYKLDKSLIGQLRNKIIIRNGRHGDIGMYDVEIKPGVYKMLADSVSFGGIKNAPFKITIKLRSGYLDIISSHKDISNMRQNMKKTSKPNLPNESKEELNEQDEIDYDEKIIAAFKKGVHNATEEVDNAIKKLLQFYSVPAFTSQSEEFRTAFENITDMKRQVEALLKLSNT